MKNNKVSARFGKIIDESQEKNQLWEDFCSNFLRENTEVYVSEVQHKRNYMQYAIDLHTAA